jgi:cellulose synthase/poly-beta-1,6-N-acetylglucosamine synthase-like glycosyltransferase
MRLMPVLILEAFYIVAVIALTIYGANALWLTWQLLRKGQSTARRKHSCLGLWPTVTIQLPIYNERHVAERLLDACARLDYPADRLQIQVLDDSTDETQTILERRARYWQRRDVNVTLLRRGERTGFKAGALAYAFPQASGDFIAIFDADFAPPPHFLRSVIPTFFSEEGRTIGFVQTRWGHLNEDYSALTRAQALALDGHFVVEQAGRYAAGYPFGFNGSAGIWRSACIADPAVGGWQADSLCEDLDLSYRAQLAGWRPCYLNEIMAPAEIPPQLIAFRRQQFRWAKGSIQTLRKLATRVWRSDWSTPARLSSLIHLGGYLIHPCLLLLLLVSLPLMLLGADPATPLTLLSMASFGPPLLYAVAQYRLHPEDWWKRWSYLPLLTLLGTGLCLNNSIAVWQGLRGQGGQFLRTPKFHVETTRDVWRRSNYRLPLDGVWFGEIGLMLYALLTAWTAMTVGKWLSAPFLLIYAGGFGLMVFVGLWQARPAPKQRPAINQVHV